MSRLLGPFSVTTRSVSERASAFAGDQIAGAGIMAPAAIPETDLRKSRRFIGRSKRGRGSASWEAPSQGSCQILIDPYSGIKPMIGLSICHRAGEFDGHIARPLAYIKLKLPNE